MSRLSEFFGAIAGGLSITGRDGFRARGRWHFSETAITVPLENEIPRRLGYAGGLVRKIARQLIRPRPGISAPGTPPHSHHGLLRDSIFYQVDGHSVTIGAAEFSSQLSYSVPDILEFGGVVEREGSHGKRIRQRFAARPYMRPALERAIDRYPDLFENML